eukprot:scaffold50683_cov45-Cyclotella_meneghiniana.AAC.4
MEGFKSNTRVALNVAQSIYSPRLHASCIARGRQIRVQRVEARLAVALPKQRCEGMLHRDPCLDWWPFGFGIVEIY